MPLCGSPKKFAQDLADGYFALTPASLKTYSDGEIKIVLTHIAVVGRDLRGEQIPLDDVAALKSRNMKLSRLHQNEVVVRAYCKKKRIPV